MAFLVLNAIMAFPMMVATGLVLGVTEPRTPIGFAITFTPGSEKSSMTPTEGRPFIKFQWRKDNIFIFPTFPIRSPIPVSATASCPNATALS